MDLQTLSNLFGATLSPDPNARKAAELEIRRISPEPGIIAALLQIIAADSVDVPTRQACAVWVKNRVFSNYEVDKSRRPDQVAIADADRQALKANIFQLIATSPSRSITLQLASTLKNIVSYDLPDKWPGLTGEIKGMLNSGEVRLVHAGCIAALEAIRAFRHRQKNDLMPPLVAELFPSLVTIATQMMNTPPSESQEIPTMLHLILKTYKTSIILNLSAHQQSSESLVPWGQLFFSVINLAIPKGAVPEDEDDRERSEWWKAKKWAYTTLGSLFRRYGNPSQMGKTLKAEYATFSQHFVTMFAPEILNTYLRQVELFVSGQAWLSRKCQYQIFSFFSDCVKPKSTWILLKPHFETLLSTFVFPRLCFTPAKQELWEADPVDYVRLSVDEYESFATPAAAAATFILCVAANRTKATFATILGFINNVLRSNQPAHQRFGALNMTSSLAPWIMSHPEVKENMEQFILQHVTPEFTAPEPYMRAIACEVLGTVAKSDLKWTNPESLNANFTAVANGLDDREFPVKVQAALALTELIVRYESVKMAVAPQVGKVIQDLLSLADETDLEILNHSMEVMVNQFHSELMPVAAQLTARLCESYLRLAQESIGSVIPDPKHTTVQDMEQMFDGDDDKTYAAMGVAKTIYTVVASIDSAPEILSQVQEVIIPIIMFTLENKLLELFDTVYDLVDSLTFRSRSISPNMWPVFEITYRLFKSDAVDFLEEMLPSLDNFVSYGSEVIQSRQDYKQMLLDIYTTSITSSQLGENDRVNGCKLAESMLLNLRGHVDDALQPIIMTALDHIDKAETRALRLANLEVLINAVLYNPSAALHIMETRPGAGRLFFDKWFTAIKSADALPRVHDKKLTIVTLCALMEMPPNAIPETLQSGWAGLLAGVLTIFTELPKAIAARKELEDSLSEEEEDDEVDENMLNLNDDDEDVWDDETAYLELLASEGARLREKSENAVSSAEVDEDSDEEDSDESDIDEELGYISPLDTVNPYISFKQALNTFQIQNAAGYAAAAGGLDRDQQALLMEVLRIAETDTAVQA
ncbi:armadillo-type protein [Mycena floridula]|nr:armadillo-type protein [Mycena floridula]